MAPADPALGSDGRGIMEHTRFIRERLGPAASGMEAAIADRVDPVPGRRGARGRPVGYPPYSAM